MNKHSQHPLKIKGKYFFIVQRVIEKLHKVPRTGYVDRGVTNPETVGEHTDEMILIAEELFHIPGLTTMLKVHDWAESKKKIGDRRTDSLCPPERRWTKEKKYKAELKAMKNICSRLGPYGPRILRLWLEFEEKRTWRSKIANQIDKFQMIKRAIKYQKAGQPVIAQEFIDHDGPKIKNYLLSFELTKARLKL